ncbi:MAG TPA: polyprenyl synthetase family protein [Anaerolineales bacterium]|jgi:geranylgeranyl pyrophosphate synthase|nr:polyprenyl synthetase family protein [Anaerolineales bacterium]
MTVTFLKPIQTRLQEVEVLMRAQTVGNHPDLVAAMHHLIQAGGKRIRPVVTLLTGGNLGADPDRLLCLAAAVELLHTATLVHDDLIDGALLRRGSATINAQWTPAATVLTGDFIFARAAKLAADTGSVMVMQLFAEALTTIVNGEITQYFRSKGIANREDYYTRIYAKTASMFELASEAAAVLSPVDDQIVETARRFGYEIGMAFQIVDDVLDFTGEQARVGKPIGSDLRQGLITLPALYYFDANPNDPDMHSVIERNGHNRSQLDRLIDSIRVSGAIELALEEADDYVQRGLGLLEDFPYSPERDALAELASYITRRNT